MNSKAVAEYIAGWLEEYRLNSRTAGYVVGISGGIDSAVVSTLAAMTGARVLCVTLPIHQPESHVSRAAEHIAFLQNKYPNVEAVDADLTAAYDVFYASMPHVDDEGRENLAAANMRSRMRMTALYYYAGLENMLVAGTGNKIEDFGIGFFTKYGDGGVDVSPIADLTKTEVFELGRHLGIPQSILDAKPTDGLFADDRSDEDQIGASYPELEWAMQQAENSIPPEAFSGRQREVYDIYLRRNRTNRHKIDPIPVAIIPTNIR